MEIVVDDKDITRVILEHLQRRGHIAAMRALEKESGVEADILGEDAAFLRALVLDGRWDDAVTLLAPLRRSAVVHEKAIFEVRKQEFLEMLENKAQGDNATILVKALQRLERGCSRKEFNDLCFCLTLPGVRSHPDYAAWSPSLGRMWCFEALREYLGLLFPGQETPNETVPEGQLEVLCKQACLFQAAEARREEPLISFPRSAVGGLLSRKWDPKMLRDSAQSNGNGHAAHGVPHVVANGEREEALFGEGMNGNYPRKAGSDKEARAPQHATISPLLESGALPFPSRGADYLTGSDDPSPRLVPAPDIGRSTSAIVPASGVMYTEQHTSRHQRPLSETLAHDPGGGGGDGNAGSRRPSVASSWYQPESLHGGLSSGSGHDNTSLPRSLGANDSRWTLEGGNTGLNSNYKKRMASFNAPELPSENDQDFDRYYGEGSGGTVEYSNGENNVNILGGNKFNGTDGNSFNDFDGKNVKNNDDGQLVGHDGFYENGNVGNGMGGSSAGGSVRDSKGGGAGAVWGGGTPKIRGGTPAMLGAAAAAAAAEGSPITTRRDMRLVTAHHGRASPSHQRDYTEQSNHQKQQHYQQQQYQQHAQPPWAVEQQQQEYHDQHQQLSNRTSVHTPSSSGGDNQENSARGSDESLASCEPLHLAGAPRGRRRRPPRAAQHQQQRQQPPRLNLAIEKQREDVDVGASGGCGGEGPLVVAGGEKALIATTNSAGSSSAPPPPSGATQELPSSKSPIKRRSPPPIAWEISMGYPVTVRGNDGATTGGGGMRGHSAEPSSKRRHSGAWTGDIALADDQTLDEEGWGQVEGVGVGVGSGQAGGGSARGRRLMRQRSRSLSPERARSGEEAADIVVQPLGNGRRSRWQENDISGDTNGGTVGGSSGEHREGEKWKFLPQTNDAGDEAEGLHGGSEASWRNRGQGGRGCGPPGTLAEEDAPKFTPTMVMRGTHPVRAVTFSPDGWLFAAGSNNRALRVCRAPIEDELACAPEVVDEEGSLRIFESPEVLRRDSLHRGSIYCLSFSPDSSLIATGSNDKMVRLLQLPPLGIETASPLPANAASQDGGEPTEGLFLRGHTGTIRDLCFPWCPQSERPFAAKREGEGYPIAPPRTSSRIAVDAATAGRLLTVGAGDFVCRVWDVEGGVASGGGGAGEEVGDAGGWGAGDPGIAPVVMFRGHTATVFSCAMLPGGNVAITGGADSMVRMWDTRTGGSITSQDTASGEVLCVRPWPGDPERLVATSHDDGSCFLWDLRTGRSLSSMFHHTDQTRALDFSADGQSLLTASYDGLTGVCSCRGRSEATIGGWNLPTMARVSAQRGQGGGEGETQGVGMSVLATLRAHRGRVLQACWRPTGPPAFLTSSTDCSVLLWSLPQSQMRE